MADRQPTDAKNLDGYDAQPIPWKKAHDLLANGPKGPLVGFFLGTVDVRGRPHAAGIGPVWHDGDLYFTSGPQTLKSKNLATNAPCTLSVKLPDMDLTLEGEAQRVVEPQLLELLASKYRDLGWPAEVADDAFTAPFSAPSAGPPPWHVYRFTFHTIVGLGTSTHGAMLWRFA